MTKKTFIRMLLAAISLVCFASCSIAIDQKPTSNSAKSESISNKTKTRYIEDAPRNRVLYLGNEQVSESEFGGVERWYAVDKFGDDKTNVRFQVGYFIDNQIGFILYEGGSRGELATYHRQGLDRRWDWGHYYRDGSSRYRYSLVIEPDGTGYYYDFSTSKDGTSSARGVYKMRKF